MIAFDEDHQSEIFPPRKGSSRSVLVMKFGSSVLRSEDDLQTVAEEIRKNVLAGFSVVAVVSAIGSTTEDLLAQAGRMAASPSPHHTAMLLATGEVACASLLAMRCETAGLSAVVAGPVQVGLLTRGPLTEAEPVALNTAALQAAMDEHAVVIVPGFIGCDDSGHTTLLGRGGSDLTAVFLASQLGARCRLVKDVDGLYDADPNGDPHAKRLDQVSWDEAIAIGGRIVQQRALALARDAGTEIEIGAIDSDGGTCIGRGAPVAIESVELPACDEPAHACRNEQKGPPMPGDPVLIESSSCRI